MSRLLVAVIASAGLASSASAWEPPTRCGPYGWGPYSTTVAWPSVTPSSWYTNTYNFYWYYPWFAYYNFSQGPYANWPAGGGYAAYAWNGPAGVYYWPRPPAEPYTGDGSAYPTSSYNSLRGMVAKPANKKAEQGDQKKDKASDEKPKQ